MASPSQLHTDLTKNAVLWLRNMAKPLAFNACPEIKLCDGYVADACVCMHLKSDWGLSGKRNSEYTFIIESKATFKDFNKTFKNGKHLGDRLIPKANFHFIVIANGIIPDTKLIPSFWGALEYYGNGLRMIKMPSFCAHSEEYMYQFAYQIWTNQIVWGAL